MRIYRTVSISFMQRKTRYGFSLLAALFLLPMAAYAAEKNTASPEFFIVDSWLTGYFSGLFKGSGDSLQPQRFRSAWKQAGHRAKMDARIWGGLVASDTNLSAVRQTGEIFSRFTYQAPQTVGGFLTAHFYNTLAGKVNKVEYGFGSTSLNMNVDWPGVTLGSYILARKTIAADPDNKLFQHEYGHYLQSKRMGMAYFVRVGLPAIMSKGDHDAHPVEIDCNREGFLYFNSYFPNFKNDVRLDDKKGWNFYYNPFPATVGESRGFRNGTLQYVDASNPEQLQELDTLKVRAKFVDYVGWVAVPVPLFIGMAHAGKYNKEQLRTEEEKNAK